MPISQTKKGQNNFFPFLPSGTTGQHQTSIRPTSGMGENFLSTQNGQNGDLGQNFPSMNVSGKKKPSQSSSLNSFLLVRW
jgi:hypothetical protein